MRSRRRTPTRRPRSSWPTCAPSRSRCADKHGAVLVAQRLHPLIRAVEVFGFHLATVDLRQSSDKHEAVVAELLATARIEPDYAALAEEAKQTLLLRLLDDARPLRVPDADYSPLRAERDRDLRGGPHGARALRRGRRSATTSSATPKR